MTTRVKCPTCDKDVAWIPKSPFRPFCSDKCRLLDLGDWASEKHAIAGRDGEAEWLNNGNGSSDGESCN